MQEWVAAARAEILEPGVAVHLSSTSESPLAVGDAFTLDVPKYDFGRGHVEAIDERQMTVQFRNGSRLTFRRRREDEETSGITTPPGEDWVLLAVSPPR